MKALASYVIVLSGLACVRAQFSPVADSSPPKKDASSCGTHQPKASCDSQIAGGDPCDPVCQAGRCDDWCTQKCSIAADGTTGCSKKGEPERDTLFSCTISYPGTSSQYDDCKPGNICLPAGGTGSSYCFAHCRSSADCVGAAPCSLRSLSTKTGPTALQVRVCDPPYSTCNSAAAGGGCCDPVSNLGCGDNQTCYLVSPSASTPDPKTLDNLTVCDFPQGTGTKRAPCSSVRDCADGWSCNGLSGFGLNGVCQQVCAPNDTTHPCPGGGICMPVGKQYGFCP